ncbi:hypothetical protein FKM82_022395 [Ascaphus truei]
MLMSEEYMCSHYYPLYHRHGQRIPLNRKVEEALYRSGSTPRWSRSACQRGTLRAPVPAPQGTILHQ